MPTVLLFGFAVAFVLVFFFIGWRLRGTGRGCAGNQDVYICPQCNEKNCECRKENPGT